VIQTGQQVTTREAQSSQHFYQDYYAGFNVANSANSSSKDTRLVQYYSSPISGFGDLLYLDPSEAGLPGSQHLPRIGTGTVTTSEREASEWLRNSHYAELNVGESLSHHQETQGHSKTLLD